MSEQENRRTACGKGILFLNTHQATSGIISGSALPREYVLTCKFLGCGVIDRTSTLNQGFDYVVLDPIPAPVKDGCTFEDICDAIGTEIVSEALESKRRISVLWSGGIDSTTALIAIMKAAEAQDQHDLVEILLSIDSINEYPKFYLDHIDNKYCVKSITHPISDFLNPDSLTVTGEHGDQLFGNYLLQPYVHTGAAQLDYQDVLPLVITERLGSAKNSNRVMRFLEPQIATAPLPILTLFDCMWWLNFSLKWQQVTLRLPVFCKERVREIYESLHHFFRDPRFQSWSLGNRAVRFTPVWELYKHVAKQYILEFTGDVNYFLYKEKEASLKNVMISPEAKRENHFEVFMREDFHPIFTLVERRH